MVYSNRLVALSPPGLSQFPLQGYHILSCRSSRANRNETSAARFVTKVRISREMPFSHYLQQTLLSPFLVVYSIVCQTTNPFESVPCGVFYCMPDLHQPRLMC